ncbi:lipid-A-disaccharide synthase N-terminal domain-containing protein [uncultured Dokdonia sp.]|uniref:lipid-A-disaccharide synthase N-terminal domain-containing protein n=1 Tax=uncultured Dokdonia sp. TaxID=575653 RepID=UPI00262363C0|nr:lipid-A-disaccharide synthase N-terminal domain-containing protein [uncultured Dokdonia sp.]
MDSLSLLAVLAQILFGGRMLSQWLLSEKRKKVVTPLTFWWLSLSGSFVLFIYGYFRTDFPLMLGQVLGYIIYIRNLQIQKQWKLLPKWSQFLIIAIPIGIIAYGWNNGKFDLAALFSKDEMATWLLTLGIVAQVLFTLRFVYQWFYAEKNKEATLPLGFWLFSFTGGLLSLVYFLYRVDYVMVLSYSLGTFIYARNIYLHYISKTA